MKIVEPQPQDGTIRVVYGEGRSDVKPLPANVNAQGVVMSEFQPTPEDLVVLLLAGRIRLHVWTAGNPLQPVYLEAIAGPPNEPKEPKTYECWNCGTAMPHQKAHGHVCCVGCHISLDDVDRDAEHVCVAEPKP